MNQAPYTAWLKTEHETNAWGTRITLPAGTQLRHIGKGEYAVSSVELLVELTGNTHDPKYRYLVVPADVITFDTPKLAELP